MSLEYVAVRAISLAAVAVQGVIDTLTRRPDHDWDRYPTLGQWNAAFGGADQLADAEAERDAWESNELYDQTSAAASAGPADSPVEECDIPPSPSTGRSDRPTSRLLSNAADGLEMMTRSPLPGKSWGFDVLVRELRERAEMFIDIEDE